MTQQEMQEKFASLYQLMANSNEPKYMKIFGDVMVEMMNWAIKNQPSSAEIWIEKLCAIKWRQYLTKSEALRIINSMDKMPWDLDVWEMNMKSVGLECERKFMFNKYAMWVQMSYEYAHSMDVISAMAFETPITEIPKEKVLKIVHALAEKSLTDEYYCIREFFME